MALTLCYWPVKARNYLPIVLANAGHVPLVQKHEFDLGAMKPSLPFGQLPYLTEGDNVKIAQSSAVSHYIARKGNLLGDNDVDFGMSEMFFAEFNDIYGSLAGCQYSSEGKANAYTKFFAADGECAKQLTYLEKLVRADGKQFTHANKPLLGDYAIAVALDFLHSLEPTCLHAFPKLKEFHAHMLASEAFKGVKDFGGYFSRA